MGNAGQGERLTTQNLLAAAALYERSDRLNWQAIRQLSLFIDLFCFHDRVTVLGRQGYSMFLDEDTDFFHVARDFVAADEFSCTPKFINPASARLWANLDHAISPENCRQLIEAVIGEIHVEHAFSLSPNEIQDFKMGEMWLRTLPSHVDIVDALARDGNAHRSVLFFVRTLMYVTYAELHQVPFTPDETRSSVLHAVLRVENGIRERLRQVLADTSPKRLITEDFGLTRNITPLAAIVFDRAWPEKKSIPREMVKLRDELAPMRARIRQTEEEVLWGSGEAEVRAKQKWEAVFREIDAAFGQGLGTMSIRGGLGFIGSAARVLEGSAGASTWISAILGLPLDIARTTLRQRPAVELFRLKEELPGTASLRRKAVRLFGEIDP